MLLRLLLLVLCFKAALSSVAVEDCIFQDTCERCLGAHLNCAWCTDKLYENRYRCLERELLLQYGCNEHNIYENKPEYQILQNATLADYDNNKQNATQIQPQRAYVKLVKSHSQSIKLTYRPALNNLLDLYVLMDLTWTMRDDKETLVQLGTELTEALSNLTNNFRIGFGSFADKPTLPMTMLNNNQNPCAPEQVVCEPTYGFKHHLSLTNDISKFISSVNASQITGNLDNLEGGMEALMQVLVCTDFIGWRQNARKIVILVTDGLMHFAGDGLLAGVIQRNDKKCHLSKDGEYLAALTYDYPSLEEIYRELLLKKINVIFAVTAEVVNSYRQLAALMQELSNTEILRADSSNILELIKKSYESIARRVQITDNSPSIINVEYMTDCGSQFKTLRKRNFCSNVTPGQEIDFYVTLTLTDFPEQNNTYIIRIEESGFVENLELEVEIQKPCTCDELLAPNDEMGRDQCGNNGFLHCGMCLCDENWTGTFCTCTIDNSHNNVTTEEMEIMCRQKLSSTALGTVCTNRGECDCGTCYCFPGYIGKYCECADCDDSCDLERSVCVCGQCVCKYGWSGNQCNCEESNHKCEGPTGEICSERGQCECGKCNCEKPYTGRYCEIGEDSFNRLCALYEPCVTCLIDEHLKIRECNDFANLCQSIYHFTYTFAEPETDIEMDCFVRMECDHFFKYPRLGQEDNSLIIRVNNCEPTNYVALMSFIVVATFLFGMFVILIIWWIFRLKAAHEYARFEEYQRLSKREENPIYRDPVTRYEVPNKLNEQNKNFFL